jgi:hypothetical protein
MLEDPPFAHHTGLGNDMLLALLESVIEKSQRNNLGWRVFTQWAISCFLM